MSYSFEAAKGVSVGSMLTKFPACVCSLKLGWVVVENMWRQN